jgi:hypothetical protein
MRSAYKPNQNKERVNGGDPGSGNGHQFWYFLANVDYQIVSVADQSREEYYFHFIDHVRLFLWHFQQNIRGRHHLCFCFLCD